MKVQLTWPWTGPNGRKHKKGDVVQVDRATGSGLVRGGLARVAESRKTEQAEPAKPAPAVSDEKVK